jgi:hypothetical protein
MSCKPEIFYSSCQANKTVRALLIELSLVRPRFVWEFRSPAHWSMPRASSLSCDRSRVKVVRS